jgi:hypothetical protein
MRYSTAIALLLTTQLAHAQTANLTELLPARDCTRVTLRTVVEGERIFPQDGEKKTQPVKLTAEHRFIEKVLATHDKTGLAAKTARQYESIQSQLNLSGSQVPTTGLRADRAIVVAQRSDDGFAAYSLGGPLTRDELDLVGDHFDTLSLTGLLPGKEVAVGDTWKVGNPAAVGLGMFEALEVQDLTGKLDAVAGEQAKISITGTAKGIDAGASVVLTISANITFDLTRRKITAMEWKQTDVRGLGPVSPEFKGTVTVTLNREPVDEPKPLVDAALESVPTGFEIPAGLLVVEYRDPQGRFTLNHPRDWRLTGATAQQTTFRLLDRGEFLTQATITPFEKVAPGQHSDVAKFKADALASPGWNAESVLDEGEVKAITGRFAYRVTATGETDGIKVVQSFFLIAGPNGDQAVVTFQTRQQSLSKLGARDLAVIEGLEFKK